MPGISHTIGSSSLVCRPLVFETTTIGLAMQGKSGSPKRSDRKREKAFGAALQALRKEHGLSQEQLGFDSGYHRTYVSFLARGLKSPSLSTIMDLAETLEMSAAELVRRTEEILARPH